MFQRCPKCGHEPLPADQSLPAACPACGVILAKVARGLGPHAPAGPAGQHPAAREPAVVEDEGGLLLHVPEQVDAPAFWSRVLLLAAFAAWGLYLVSLDYRDGEINSSFIHGPLLVFHEAGHVLFRPFGEWISVLGGTLGQLLMPALLGGALLLKNRDPFGAALGLWLLGASLLDVAPYVYDAQHPQLILLSGTTGEGGGHDWIYLLSSMHLLAKAQTLGALLHTLGAGVLLLALVWGGWVIKRQHARLAPSAG
jgi:hypothetical protein